MDKPSPHKESWEEKLRNRIFYYPEKGRIVRLSNEEIDGIITFIIIAITENHVETIVKLNKELPEYTDSDHDIGLDKGIRKAIELLKETI